MIQQTSGPWLKNQSMQIEYLKPNGLAWLCIKNALLKIITFGIYSFWAKTHVRRHIWSGIHINQTQLLYHGTGLELFLGALFLVVVIFIPISIIQNVTQYIPLFVVPLFLYIYGVGVYSARNYRLSRTTWRGIKGAMNGNRFQYGLFYFIAAIVKIISIGWATPAMNIWITAKIRNETQFGKDNLKFNAKIAPLYIPFAIAFLIWIVITAICYAIGVNIVPNLNIPIINKYAIFIPPIIITLSAIIAYFFSFIVYKTAEIKYMMKSTSWKNFTFSIDVTYQNLMTLIIKTFLIRILTLGIATPYAQEIVARFYCQKISISGQDLIADIRQSEQMEPKIGEGVMSAFDVDVLGGVF